MEYGDINYSTELINNILQKANTLTVPTKVSELTNDSKYITAGGLKTINGLSIVGSGNIEISGTDSGIADAPSDGETYGRNNGNWVKIEAKAVNVYDLIMRVHQAAAAQTKVTQEDYNTLFGYLENGTSLYMYEDGNSIAVELTLDSDKMIIIFKTPISIAGQDCACFYISNSTLDVTLLPITFVNKDYIASTVALKEYSKAETYTPIIAEDTINSAIGKLEAGLNNVGSVDITDICDRLYELAGVEGTCTDEDYNALKGYANNGVVTYINVEDFMVFVDINIINKIINVQYTMYESDIQSNTLTIFSISTNKVVSATGNQFINRYYMGIGILGTYTKPSAYLAITQNDSISAAIGKLEAGLIGDAPDENSYARKKGEWVKISIPDTQESAVFTDINFLSVSMPEDGGTTTLTEEEYSKIHESIISGKILRIRAICGRFFGFSSYYGDDLGMEGTDYINVFVRSIDSDTPFRDAAYILADFSVNISVNPDDSGLHNVVFRKCELPLFDAPIDGIKYARMNGRWVKDTNDLAIIEIDQTISDPATMISGDVNGLVIQWIRKNSHRVLAKKTGNGTVTYIELDDNNSNKYAYDGSEAKTDGTEGDVFVKLPTFYYKGTEGDNVKLYFSLSKIDDEYVEWDTNTLIGAYEAYYGDGKLYSRSGVGSSGSISQSNFKSYAAARGSGYQLVDWQMHCVLGCLFYAMYGNTNSQAICGSGTDSYTKICGETNSLGMNDTTSENGNTMSINFWGLENWWGNKYEWIEGIQSDKDTVYILSPDPSSGRSFTWDNGSTYGKHYRFGKYLDLSSDVTSSGSNSTYYCDYNYGPTTSARVVRRSGNDASMSSGVSYAIASDNSSYMIADGGSRLAFRGVCTKAESVEAFKSLPIL